METFDRVLKLYVSVVWYGILYAYVRIISCRMGSIWVDMILLHSFIDMFKGVPVVYM